MIPNPAFSRHGGAIAAAQRAYPDAPSPWLDLSTGINPIPYPIVMPSAEEWARLPEAEALAELEQAAAACYGVRSARVLAAPGTQAIIQRLPTLLRAQDVRILGPTYAEFARVFAANGDRVTNVTTLGALAGADAAVVVNPNNPDGRLTSPDDLVRLAAEVGTLIVDEAFVDALEPAASIVSRLTGQRIILLRSFGKIYGLAGLRLGFAILPEPFDDDLRRSLGPWSVSGPAIAIGQQALADHAWLDAARLRLTADGMRLAGLLARAGANEVGHTPLFRLVAHRRAPALFDTLARHGILVRPFADAADRLRFGLPGSEAEWDRLEGALRALVP